MHAFPEQGPGRPGSDGGVEAGGVTTDGLAGGGSARRGTSAGFAGGDASTIRGAPLRCAVTYDCEGSVLASARPSPDIATRLTYPP
ncbi:MAG TPA: hypothetical protein VF197_07925, partial [Methylomirabilota bacterium]